MLNKQPDGAVAAYSRSITSFRSSIAQNPGFRDSSVHYISLGLAGRGRLRLQAGQLDESLEDLRDSIAENPATATWEDGLGNSPAETAEELYRALTTAGRDTEANSLKAVYAEHGVQIGIGEGG